jgi:hypothetical protein
MSRATEIPPSVLSRLYLGTPYVEDWSLPYRRVVEVGLELELIRAVRCSKFEVAILASASSVVFLSIETSYRTKSEGLRIPSPP